MGERWDGGKVIAALRGPEHLESALKSPCGAIFLLSTTLAQLPGVVQRVRGARKRAFVHMDLVQGLSSDEAGLEYLAAIAAPDGIISTRAQLIRSARRLGIQSVYRIFILDSQALESGLQHVERSRPDIVELLPGIIPSVIRCFRQSFARTPIIAGGLIRQPSEVADALAAGADAISTGSVHLWQGA